MMVLTSFPMYLWEHIYEIIGILVCGGAFIVFMVYLQERAL